MSLQTLRGPVKIGLVAAGYVAAFLIATVVMAVYVASTSGPDRSVYAAMYAFGDSVLFLAVFGAAGTVPTGAAFYFLRPYPWVWRALRAVAFAAIITALATVSLIAVARTAGPGSSLHAWLAVSGLRVALAPVLGTGFFLSALFAPHRSYRIVLAVATVLETVTFIWAVVVWLYATAPPR